MTFISAILTLLLSASSGAAEGKSLRECQQPGLFRFTVNGQTVAEPSSYCYDEGRGELLSLRCEKGKCAALSEKICALPALPPHAAFASPGGWLCDQLGGKLQDGAFYDGKEWWDMDRCLFPEDKSFVDSGLLAARRGQCPAKN